MLYYIILDYIISYYKLITYCTTLCKARADTRLGSLQASVGDRGGLYIYIYIYIYAYASQSLQRLTSLHSPPRAR